MPYMLVRHKVEDYARWRRVFDEHAEFRKASGSKGCVLYRSADNPDEIIVLIEWDTMDNARTFMGSQKLREAMQLAGVADRPDVYFIDIADKLPA